MQNRLRGVARILFGLYVIGLAISVPIGFVNPIIAEYLFSFLAAIFVVVVFVFAVIVAVAIFLIAVGYGVIMVVEGYRELKGVKC